MFNAPIKLPLLLGSATILLSSIIASCSSDSTSSEAESLYAQASDAFNAGHYEQSLSLIDSIDTAYPRAIDIRKQCRLLKPQVIERLAALRISAIDSLLALNAYRGDSLRSTISLEKNPVEGYYVGVDSRGVDVLTSPGIHSRVSPDYHFYFVASCPKPIGLTSVSVEIPDGQSASTPAVTFDGERSTRHSSCQTITFTETESAPIAQFVEQHRDQPITIRFRGDSGNHTMPLSDTQRRSLTSCYGLVAAANNDKALRLESEKWQRQLQVARTQLATVADTTSRH